MISLEAARKHAAESLDGFPPEVVVAYLAFAEKGSPADLDTVVFGVLRFYLVKKPAGDLAAMPGSTRLIEDLGCDSLTMMDTVFMVESILDLKLDDERLAGLKTIDDLRNYLRQLTGLAVG